MKPIRESVLFRTSAASDIQCSGGVLAIAGLPTGAKKKSITSIKQVKYRAEVVQVVTVGGTAYTPTGSTAYNILIGDTNRQYAGAASYLKKYTYVTPLNITDLGATAALQREAIHAALVTKINADASNYVVAASLGTGTGLTITDDAGYYPPFRQGMTNRKGASTVLPEPNRDGSGFAETNVSTTTAAVYSFGVGADLVYGQPIVDFMFGNLIQGSLDVPIQTAAGLPAVSGQKYDGFVIESLTEVPAHNVTGQYALVPKIQLVVVDNGTGTDATNLAGFKAFERVMHKLAVEVYKNDAGTTQQWFDNPLVMQDPLGAAPTGTANTLGWLGDPQYGLLNKTNIGAATVVSPVLNADGLLLDQDNTNTEGAHYSANQQTLSDRSFIVGKTPFSVVARVVAADWTDAQFLVGFRKKAAYTADYNDYTDLAAIGGGAADGDSIYTFGILNNAATVATDSNVNFADAVSMLLKVSVDINGTVTASFANASGGWTNASIYSVGTTALVLDSGDEMIPFFQFTNIAGGDPDLVISEFFAVATDKLLA